MLLFCLQLQISDAYVTLIAIVRWHCSMGQPRAREVEPMSALATPLL